MYSSLLLWLYPMEVVPLNGFVNGVSISVSLPVYKSKPNRIFVSLIEAESTAYKIPQAARQKTCLSQFQECSPDASINTYEHFAHLVMMNTDIQAVHDVQCRFINFRDDRVVGVRRRMNY